jgi:hypothetical protein
MATVNLAGLDCASLSDWSGNRIGDEGASSIAAAIKINTATMRLDLSGTVCAI